ncbi:6,7-dimethyl-8-ribityllumazine synthase [Roseomonas sp. OT10]|uniref:6,7-dimethyl-8-ribityllumazine synthase n=1 Tax=Roseomonas cutis TaxID=2897332 RepID=UPI001E490ED1|nr:6,7-dimethyl-8-ribityllumazine synthase [Roseomonas sp. OT10]UFN50757.1 6,7-dimethyl-8-ribityllumazine synthase [Roseomonas sp. OT10]
MSTQDAPERGPVTLAGRPARLLLIQAPYYAEVVGGMRDGALAVFREAGATLDVVDVAGAFELPAALRMALRAGAQGTAGVPGGYDGFLILGCVVRGETDHYEHICREACRGVMDIAVETAAPIGFGLLTVATMDQAVARSRPDRHNKGAEAAHALLGQVALARRLGIAG